MFPTAALCKRTLTDETLQGLQVVRRSQSLQRLVHLQKHPQQFQASGRGLPHAYDASWLRMAPELQQIGCGMAAHWWEAKYGA